MSRPTACSSRTSRRCASRFARRTAVRRSRRRRRRARPIGVDVCLCGAGGRSGCGRHPDVLLAGGAGRDVDRRTVRSHPMDTDGSAARRPQRHRQGRGRARTLCGCRAIRSRSPHALTVPDIVGQLQTAAESAIATAGLPLAASHRVIARPLAQGSVFSQNPAAGSHGGAGCAGQLRRVARAAAGGHRAQRRRSDADERAAGRRGRRIHERGSRSKQRSVVRPAS